ncbi:hypothetical protein JCM15060_12930 [Halanaerobaculum tunisiense]
MAAKAAVRDVGRVLGASYDKTDKVANTISKSLDLAESEELQKLYQSDKEVQEIIDYAQQIEGLSRHASTHAAGVVITKEKLTNYTPLYQSDGEVTTQYAMDDLEALGLLKMDFLGLRTLTVIDKTLDLIKQTQGVELKLDQIPFADQEVFDLLSAGHSLGVFQLESDGMRRLIAQLKPEEIEDIIALLALYRPGPLGSGMVEDFIARRHGNEEIEYPHPDLQEILEPTYGVILYQEQVMQIVQQIAGYSLGEADILRRSMGKKKPEVMRKHRDIFIKGNDSIPGAVNNGYSQELAEELFELIEHFGGYGFNKAHSVAYAYVSYQTAYLKTHYPVEFMAALLTSQIEDSDQVAEYITEVERMGLEVLPPDVNYSQSGFSVEKGAIRFGLQGIKHVGQKAIEELIATREEEEFKDFTDFCQRVDLTTVNKQAIESLIKAGAFVSLPGYRSQLLKVLPQVYKQARKVQAEESKGQTNFSDLFATDNQFTTLDYELPAIEEFTTQKLLALEKEMLGLYLSGDPLDQVLPQIKVDRNQQITELSSEENQVVIGGLITSQREVITKNQRQMAFLTIADETGEVEVISFPDSYQEYQDLLEEESAVIITGQLNQEGKVIIDQVTEPTGRQEVVHLQLEDPTVDKIQQLEEVLAKYRGAKTTYLHLVLARQRVSIQLGEQYQVAETSDLKQELDDLAVQHSF